MQQEDAEEQTIVSKDYEHFLNKYKTTNTYVLNNNKDVWHTCRNVIFILE